MTITRSASLIRTISIIFCLGFALSGCEGSGALPELDPDQPFFQYRAPDSVSFEVLADRYDTTPDRIRELNKTQPGPLVYRVPNRPPHRLERLQGSMTPAEFSRERQLEEATVRRLNRFALQSRGEALNVYVLPEREHPWFFARFFYQQGFENLSWLVYPLAVALPLLLLGLLFLGVRLFQKREPAPVAQAGPKPQKAWIEIEVLKGARAGERLRLEQEDALIGRGANCRLRFENDSMVSGMHGEIYYDNEGWHYRDVASTNGSFVGGRRVENHRLSVGDVIELGFEGVQLKVTPYTPSHARAVGRGTTFIREIAGTTVKGKTRVFKYGLGSLAAALIVLGIWTLAIEERVSLNEQKLSAHETELERLGLRVDQIDAQIADLEQNQVGVSAGLRELASQHAAIASQVAQNSEDIARLEQAVQQLAGQLDEMSSETARFARKVAELQAAVEQGNQARVEQLTPEVQAQYNRMRSIASGVSVGLDLLESHTGISQTSEEEARGGGLAFRFLRTAHHSIENISPVLGTAFGIVKSLVDNEIVIGLTGIANEMNLLGPFAVFLV